MHNMTKAVHDKGEYIGYKEYNNAPHILFNVLFANFNCL